MSTAKVFIGLFALSFPYGYAQLDIPTFGQLCDLLKRDPFG